MSNCTGCGTCGTGGGPGGGGQNPLPGDPDLSNSILKATPAFGGIDVTWTYPATNGFAVAHTLLYRATSADFAGAIERAVVSGNFFYDKVNTNQKYYYWIKIVSVNGTVGELIGPASATARPLIADLIEELTAKIDSGLLAQALRSELDQLSVINSNLANEIFDRETGETSFAQALLDVQNGVAQAHTFIHNEILSRTSATEAIAENLNLLAVTLNDNVAAVVQSTSAWIEEVDGKLVDIGALWTVKLTVNKLVGGFGVWNNGEEVQAGFDVDTFWVGRTQANKRKPFIIVGGETFIDEAVINKLTFSKLRDESGSFVVEDGKVKATYIDTKGLVIRDGSGNPIFGAGVGLNWNLITNKPFFAPPDADKTSDNIAAGIANQGGLATQNYAFIGSTVKFPGGQTMGTADFVNALSKINSGNISTFMDSAAIGSAYIGNLAVQNAHIENLTVGTGKLAYGAVSDLGAAQTPGTSCSVSVYVPEGAQAIVIQALNQSVATSWVGGSGETPTYDAGEVVVNGSGIGAGGGTYIFPAPGLWTITALRATPIGGYDAGTMKLFVTVYKR